MVDSSRRVAELPADRLLSLIERIKDREHGAGTAIRPRAAGGVPPLSFAQERLWFLDRLGAGNAPYLIAAALRLSGPLDRTALRRALTELVRRHESLRTAFGDQAGVPFQVIAPPPPRRTGFALPEIDLTGLPAERREAETQRLLTGEARRPFDLARGPLLRAALLLSAPGACVLCATMHHIISDGWSLTIFIRELAALYEDVSAGRPWSLQDQRLQYADFAVWQREHLQGAALSRELAWWEARLAGLAPLELPSDRPRPAVQSFRGGTRFLTLPAEPLHELARREGVSLFMVLLALWQSLLQRYSRQTDLAVGSPVAGRSRSELENVIGFFVNSVVLRTALAGSPGFRALLRRVRDVTLAAYEHDELPFEKLVEHLQPQRSRDRNPLVQVMIALQNQDWPQLAMGGLAVEALSVDTGVAKLDLSLVWSEEGSRLAGTLEYASDLFDGTTAQRLLRHFRALAEAALANCDRPLDHVSLLSAAESSEAEGGNERPSGFPRQAAVHARFARQAHATPAATAVEWGDERLSYEELDRRANRLAHRLLRRGVQPQARVGLALERSADLVVSMLAVLKAGAVYVPLDLSYPEERLALMAGDAGLSLVVAPEGAPRLGGTPLLVLERDGAEPADDEDPGIAVPAEGVAWIVYTSGSTGRPKGVAITHRSVVCLAQSGEPVPLRAGDRVAQAANVSFDAAAWEIWATLLSGASLIGIERELTLSPSALAAALAARRIGVVFLTTALFNQVVRQAPGAFAGRRVLFGGEAADPYAVAALCSRDEADEVIHLYGPAENTTYATWHRVGALPAGASTVPIGRAISDCGVHVVEPALLAAPVGVPGELWIAGDRLARGYWQRSDLTAERFVPDPWSDRLGERAYRTGDLVRWTADGVLEFLGRVDQQVKIRGFRIEPGEIEVVLREHAAIRDCVVVPREDRPGDRRLVAYLCLTDPSQSLDSGILRRFLFDRLPDFMIPASFAVLPSLPLSPNGKVDRAAVAQLAPLDSGSADGRIAPRTLAEERVASAWAELLGISTVGALDNFFELGGHSLMAVQVVSRLRDLFDVEVPVNLLFEEPTIAGLAARVEALRWRQTGPELPPIVPVPRGERPPLSFAQERLWFLEQLEPGTAFYNIPSATRITGPLRVDVLRRGLGEMVRRHESLRTTFASHLGQPGQVISPAGTATALMPLIDLSALPADQREEELIVQAIAEARRPFDLERGPLCRAPLFRLGDTDHVLAPTMHHIVSDGWSMTVINREMAELYDALAAGREPRLPELPVQYADYAVWQRDYLRGETLAAKVAYWRERLAGAPGLALPTDRPRPAVETFRGRQRPVALSATLTRALHALSTGEGTTLFMTLLAAFQTLLLRSSGQTDLPVGSPIANRYRTEIEGVIGFFANTVVLRSDLSGDPTFRALLARVREVTLGAYAHEDLPFEKLVEELQPQRDMSRNPLFQVMCVLQNQPWPALRMGDAVLSPLNLDSATAKFDLTVFWREQEGVLHGVVEHNTDLFDDSTALRLYRHYAALLEAAAADPSLPLSSLPLLSAAERHQLACEWSRAVRGLDASPVGRCVHHWVEEQAARTPAAPAVIDGDRLVSYGELNARANRLAHGLRRRGVGPEALVGICVERSLEMVVAALAVAKAGGALVALDPAYPRERLATIIDDAGLIVLLTQGSLLAQFPQHAGIALLLERGSDPFCDESSANPLSGVDVDNPIYAIYTSGSTGQPKGILVTHGAFSNLLAWQLGDSPLRSGARTVQYATFGFCVSFQEMFSSWCAGGALAMAGETTRRDMAELTNLLEEQKIERLHLPFAALKHLAEAAAGEARLPSELREVITAGEQLQVTPAVRRLFERLPECTLSNQYGASETHVVCALTLAGGPAGWPAIPPIGRPVANVTIHLLDGRLEPAPAGVPGELYAGGACVPRGYLNDPVLTAQKLLPDPYAPIPGARLYRTGDSARFLADGSIEYHGRIDTQVKIRGFRVELGEVETVLARHPEVRDAAVVARPGPMGPQLAAYVVTAASGDLFFGELRTYLKRTLPEHMVPSAFVQMEQLPLNANGKLDQSALPEPSLQHGQRADYLAPRTPVEELLAGIFSDLLGVEGVGVHEDFFALGGHSLQGTRLMAQVREAFGVDLRVRTLFEAPTVAELAVEIARALVEQAGSDLATAALEEIAASGDVRMDHV